METVNYAWRMHKCRTKKKHFYAFDTDEQRMIERPKTMPKTHFEDLLKYWHLTTTEEESQTNKKNRQKAEDIHTMGPKSYARNKRTLTKKNPLKQRCTKNQGKGIPIRHTKPALGKRRII
ncbi:uncharacterized protein LOC110713695 [Chenopodium quinoa]|uniref:uncharacterized protein LOC110713695 n=1 Tax=Chenopodium quinoa TaxID=63459 RepID=UPI000B781ECC|nr:uncharacterized protein LOC110713695 [Chenopodium quinoa]